MVSALDRQMPLVAKVTLEPLLRVLRYDRDKQRAGADLIADFSIPGIPTAWLPLIQGNLDIGGP